MRKILVLRGGALGDFIVTLPALALLRQRWPDARIELVGNATAGVLARTRGLIDVVHSQHEARWSALFSSSALPATLGAWLAGFDLVISYWPDPDGELRAHFPLESRQVFLTTLPMPARAPAAAHYCEPLRKLGLETSSYFCRIERDRIALGGARPVLQLEPGRPKARTGPIAIHPGSGSPRKNWPVARWRQLIPLLPTPVLLIVGEAEIDQWISLPSGHAGITMLALPSLENLTRHLAGCRLFLGHDSGISHLAAGCGAPCVILFGPTDPAIWAPPAPHVQVLRRAADLNSISVADVRDAAAAVLGDQT